MSSHFTAGAFCVLRLSLLRSTVDTSMSTYNPFHAKTVDAAEQRPAADVFRTSVQASDAAISSRFASGGKYTIEQLEAGADEAAPAPAEASEFDPDDKRSLYERLKAQKDAKQEEFEHRNAFKNQMYALATAATASSTALKARLTRCHSCAATQGSLEARRRRCRL